MTQPKNRNALVCAACLCIFLGTSGCGSRNAQQPIVAGSGSSEAWFCQVSAQGETSPWDCVQDAEQVRNPQPVRLPANAVSPKPGTAPGIDQQSAIDPLAPEAAPILVAPTADSVNQQPVATATSIAPLPAPQPDLGQATNSTNNAPPDYVALAYRPTEPVSILELPQDFFAVQLTALNSPEAVEAFVSENHLQGMSAAQVAAGDDLRYVLILGIYESEERARAALQGLPGPLAQFDPWLRRVGNLQEAMIAAQRLVTP